MLLAACKIIIIGHDCITVNGIFLNWQLKFIGGGEVWKIVGRSESENIHGDILIMLSNIHQ